jgi:hypothetical protein
MSGDHGVTRGIPPLEGCLYCHSSQTTTVEPGRKVLGLGGQYPVLRCSQCGALAWLDYDPHQNDTWRICYRRVNRAVRYYYVALHLGKAGWLSAQEALDISTDGYVQRVRVQQAQQGQLDWLQPAPLQPPPPLMAISEIVYLSLRGVALFNAVPVGVLARPNEKDLLDTGMFYVTDQKLHLLGQRRDWSHRLNEMVRVQYDDKSWTIILNAPNQLQQYRGIITAGQFDPQLVSAVINTLKTKS